jgi:Kyakuja-Dileera-Zisupton transposase
LRRDTKTKTDRTGLFGAFCDHGILPMAATMTKGENMRYLIMFLQIMLMAFVVPVGLFYDINCRFRPSWLKFLCTAHGLDPEVAAAAEQMHLPLPTFHAGMHNAACRQANSLQGCEEFPSFIHPNGEPAEQFWALLGAPARLKYTALHHQKAIVECTVTHHNRKLDARVSTTLVARAKKLASLCSIIEPELREASGSAAQVRTFAASLHHYGHL